MDWLAAGLLLAATVIAVGLLWLLRRLTPEQPAVSGDVVPMGRHGTIPMVRCCECGELVERHRAVLVGGGGWYCRDPEQCPPSDAP